MTYTENNQTITQQISWQPIQKNGTPLTNMILQCIEGKLELHQNILSRFFYFSFIILGSIFIIYATYELLSYNFQATLWSILLGFTLMGMGIYRFSKQAMPHIFDKNKNLYFKENDKLEIEDETPLSAIQALQVITYTQEEKAKKEAELNLVLNNGKRVYVCSYDSDKYSQIENDAEKISKYIDKPVWKKEVA